MSPWSAGSCAPPMDFCVATLWLSSDSVVPQYMIYTHTTLRCLSPRGLRRKEHRGEAFLLCWSQVTARWVWNAALLSAQSFLRCDRKQGAFFNHLPAKLELFSFVLLSQCKQRLPLVQREEGEWLLGVSTLQHTAFYTAAIPELSS